MSNNTDKFSAKSVQDDSGRLVDAIYDLALDPENFDNFSLAWDEFIRNSSRDIGNFEEVNQTLNDAMGHHFERAFKLMEKIGRDTQFASSASDYVASRRAPSVELNSAGAVLSANGSGIEFFSSSCLGSTLDDLIKQVLHADSVESVLDSFRQVSVGQKMVAKLVLLVDRNPCMLVIKRINDSNSIVIDVAATGWSSSADKILSSNYSLTAHECEIVSLLYQGLSAKRIALHRDRSEETVRTQIRSVLKKMGCESQSQLVRLLTGLVFLSGEQEHSGWLAADYPMQKMSTADTRILDFYDVGPAGAKAVVIFHGIMHTPELPVVLLESLLRRGYRVIGICRAGYGHSSPPVSWSSTLDTSADDVKAVLAHLCLSKVACIAIMGGSAFAYAFASRFPAMVDNIVSVSGAIPYMADSDIGRLPLVARAMTTASKYFPKLLPLLVRSAVAIVDRGDTEKIIQMAYRNSPVDFEVALRPDVLPRLNRAFRYTAHQGYSAYAHNGIAVMADHRPLINNIKCPINLIHGVEDKIQTLESVRVFANDYANVLLTEVEHVGQLAIFAVPEEITQRVLDALDKCEHQATG